MTFEAELTGIYPRSEQLIELTRSYDRGKTELTSVENQIRQDTDDLVRLENRREFEALSDGALAWQDQLRPIVESLDAVSTGTRYSRWFDTNSFYKKPTVTGKIQPRQVNPKKFVRTDLLPQNHNWKVTLVGPYTFSELSENLYYKSKSDLLFDVAHVENQIIRNLKSAGLTKFELAEPCLVYRPYTEEALGKTESDTALAAIAQAVAGVDNNTSVKTYFGDSARILPALLELSINSVGIDLFETDYSSLKIETDKGIDLGIVDSRESNVEDPKWIAETATRASKHIISDTTTLVPNTDLKFVPRKVADAKLDALAKATRLAQGAI